MPSCYCLSFSVDNIMLIFEVEGRGPPERCIQYQSKSFMNKVGSYIENEKLENCHTCRDGKSSVS